MKQSFLIFISILLCLSMNGQDQNKNNEPQLTVIAHVANAFTKSTISDVKVELMTEDSAVVDMQTSSKNKYNGKTGGFAFNIKKPGKYLIHCSHPDYEDSYTPLNIKKFYKHEYVRTGLTCYMQRRYIPQTDEEKVDKEYTLGEVTVKGTKVKFFVNGDTLVYNADAFQMSEGSMLDDLIKKLPGVELKSGGVILVNGRPVQSLLLNGKDFFNKDRKLILDNLPNFMVDKIKVFEQRTEMDALRSPDKNGSKDLVMDIGLKRQYSIGWIANAEVGGGTDERFLSRLFALRLTPNSSLSVFANVNNLNDGKVPDDNGGWSPLSQAVGLATQRNAGLNYNYQDPLDRYRLGGKVAVQHNDSHDNSHTNSVNYLVSGDTYGRSIYNGNEHITRISTDHRFDLFRTSQVSLSVCPSLSYKDSRSNSQFASAVLNSDVADKWGKDWMDSISAPLTAGSLLKEYALNRIVSRSLANSHSFETKTTMASFVKIPHYNLQTLFLDASVEYSNDQTKNFNLYSLSYPTDETAETDFRNRYNSYYNKSNGYEIGLRDFIRITDFFCLIPSYRFCYKARTSNSSLYLLNRLGGWGEDSNHELGELPSETEMVSTFDSDNSSFTTTRNITHKTAMDIEYNIYKNDGRTLNLQISLPVNFDKNRMDYQRASLDTVMSRNVIRFEPTVSVSYSKYPSWRYSLNYNSNVTAPLQNYFVTLRNDADPLNIFIGNPNLKNRRDHNLSTSFGRTLKNQRMYNVSASFNLTTDAISMGYVYNSTTGVKVITPMNADGNWNARLAGGYSMPLDKAKKLTMNTNTQLAYYHSVDMIGVDEGTPQRSSVGSTYVNETLKLDYKVSSKVGFGFKGDVNYTSIRSHRVNFENTDVMDFDYGLTSTAELPWNMQIATDLTMYSRRGYTEESMNSDELVWNARLSKRFMHGNLVCILDGFDILGQLSNVRRTVNAQGRVESYYNVTPRYAMLHLICRFNKQPKNK